MPKTTCPGCVYHVPLYDSSLGARFCGYLLITGHARSLICKHDACTVRREGNQVSLRRAPPTPPPHKPPDRYAARQKLYDDGMNDHEIAVALDLCDNAIRQWRHKHNLPPHGRAKKN